MGGKIIARPVDRLPAFQLCQLGAQLVEIDGIGMVEIGPALAGRRIAETVKIVILRQDHALLGAEPLENPSGQGRLAGTAAAADANCPRGHISPISRSRCSR